MKQLADNAVQMVFGDDMTVGWAIVFIVILATVAVGAAIADACICNVARHP